MKRLLTVYVNEALMTSGGNTITMPYGEYPYGTIKCPDGRTRSIMQIWNKASAIAVANSLPPEGIPVYAGHPDVESVASKYPDKGAKGWITNILANEDSAVLTIAWCDEPPAKAFKWFSPSWTGETTLHNTTSATVHVDKILSVGLVNNPNIPSFSLANEWQGVSPQKKEINMDKIIQLLKLDSSASEEQVIEALSALIIKAEATETKVEAANAEAEAEKKKTEVAKTELENERKAHTELILANALSEGRITPAGMPAWRTKLAQNFDKGKLALANETQKCATKSVLDGRTATSTKTANTIGVLVNEKMRAFSMLSRDQAWLAVKNENPTLFN